MSRKKRVSFTIEPSLLNRLRAMKAGADVSDAEQIRQAIRSWLQTTDWPVRSGTRKAQRSR